MSARLSPHDRAVLEAQARHLLDALLKDRVRLDEVEVALCRAFLPDDERAWLEVGLGRVGGALPAPRVRFGPDVRIGPGGDE